MPKPRNKKLRPLGCVLHVLCEGERTEPNYIRRYVRLVCRGNRSVKVEPTTATSPVELVEEAVKLKHSSKVVVGDQYWVVYDRESEQQCSPEQHKKAYQLAQQEGIHIAISGIAFRSMAAASQAGSLRRLLDLRRTAPSEGFSIGLSWL